MGLNSSLHVHLRHHSLKTKLDANIDIDTNAEHVLAFFSVNTREVLTISRFNGCGITN